MNRAEPVRTEESAGEVGLVTWQDFTSTEPFTFVSGATLPGLTLRYETYGRLNAARDNAILVCHALSGDHHAAGVHDLNERKPGWWNAIIGPGKPLDTNRFFVIASNCLGGCRGSTGPRAINPETGAPWNLNFPPLTINDMVHAQKRLTDHLGLSSLYAVVGGSMGGMQALAWGVLYPDCVQRLLPLATTGRQNAQAIAFNEVGRWAIMQDPRWNGGNYADGEGPDVGLAVARMMAHITYLSEQGLEAKFGRARRDQAEGDGRSAFDVEFEVESYLRYQGRSFINRFDANSYLYLTKALDRFDLHGPNGTLEETLEAVTARVLVVGFTTDWLFPPAQNRALVHALLRLGKRAAYAEIDMPLGHDSFLLHSPDLFRVIGDFLAR